MSLNTFVAELDRFRERMTTRDFPAREVVQTDCVLRRSTGKPRVYRILLLFDRLREILDVAVGVVNLGRESLELGSGISEILAAIDEEIPWWPADELILKHQTRSACAFTGNVYLYARWIESGVEFDDVCDALAPHQLNCAIRYLLPCPS